jgi:hypothetical protein
LIEFIWVDRDVLRSPDIKARVAPWKTGKKWRVDVFGWLK